MSDKPKGKGGRPSKYRPEFIQQAEKLCALGATDLEIADFFGVNVVTLYRWKNDNEQFCKALKVAKEIADQRVERSLFARANGYEHDEVHVSNYQGAITLTPIRKIYAPDTTAAIFWLKNRQPEKWRDRTGIDHDVPKDSPLAALLAGMGRTAFPISGDE